MIVTAFFTALLSSALSASVERGDHIRIINGTDVPPGKYPSQVSLQVKNYHICSGSILNRNFVLTAAHCFTSDSVVEDLRVMSASIDLRNATRTYKVAKIIMHKNYDASDLLVNDIALLKMLTPFKLREGEAVVQLPRKDQDLQSGTWGNTIGWGLTTGDSGGPIFSGGVQVGVLSWRDGSGPCGAAPAVYTKLSLYTDWLAHYAK